MPNFKDLRPRNFDRTAGFNLAADTQPERKVSS